MIKSTILEKEHVPGCAPLKNGIEIIWKNAVFSLGVLY